MNILDTIVEQKKLEVARLPRRTVSGAQLKNALAERGGHRDFIGALRNLKAGRVALIAEVKKASPSAGVICPEFDPVQLAGEYEAAGVKEYWLIDPQKRTANFYLLGEDGLYHEVIVGDGIYRSAVLDGLWIRIEWLWQDPTPPLLDVLSRIGILSA